MSERRFEVPKAVDVRHQVVFRQFQKLAVHRDRFQLILMLFNVVPYRDELVAAIEGLYPDATTLKPAPPLLGDFISFENQLAALSRDHPLIQVIDLQRWSLEYDAESLFRGLNYHREALAGLKKTLLFWLTEADLKLMATLAPDFWAWRTTILDFTAPQALPKFDMPQSLMQIPDQKDGERIVELVDYLEKESGSPTLILELGRLYLKTRQWDAALAHIARYSGDKYAEIQEELHLIELNVLAVTSPKEALAPLERALQKTKTTDKQRQILCLSARIQAFLEHFDVAHLQLDRAWATLQSHDAPLDKLELLYQRGHLFLEEGLRSKARQLFDQALTLARSTGMAISGIIVQATIANMVLEEGRLAEAESLLREAHELALKHNLTQLTGLSSKPLKAIEIRGGRVPDTLTRQETVTSEVPLVYLSYAHKDETWVRHITTHFGTLVGNGILELWEPSQITPGSLTQMVIEEKLQKASLVLVLVSSTYLRSHQGELMDLLTRADQGRLRLTWVCLDDCMFEVTGLKRFVPALPPDPPLSGLTNPEKDAALITLAEKIRELVRK